MDRFEDVVMPDGQTLGEYIAKQPLTKETVQEMIDNAVEVAVSDLEEKMEHRIANLQQELRGLNTDVGDLERNQNQ